MSQTPLFRAIDPEQLTDNPFHLIGKEWMLITAGDRAKFNMMTASWGGMGILWGRPVAICVVRPQRYTFPLMEQSSSYSLTFFDPAHRHVLDYCGSHSGRDGDKVAATGLTPIVGSSGAVYFEQARLVIECRKLYAQDLQEKGFVDHSVVDRNYPTRDFHRMYVGEVLQMLVRER
ncbi:MAG: flavin reductase family protein [Anaerolineae bacterium]|jgi:flavin reductase (DIM6/NTAB) family NADH-FMN oxidoreductase RutF|nr:flavin reductase family protein [Anaerolineae bacterium]